VCTSSQVLKNHATSKGTKTYTRRPKAKVMSQAVIPTTSSYKGVSFEITFHLLIQDGGSESWSYSLKFPPGASDDSPEEFCCLQWYADDLEANSDALSWAYRYLNGRLGVADESESIQPRRSDAPGKLLKV
jgi:hypothetical protein